MASSTYLPELGSDLVAALTGLNVDNFSHGSVVDVMCCWSCASACASVVGRGGTEPDATNAAAVATVERLQKRVTTDRVDFLSLIF